MGKTYRFYDQKQSLLLSPNIKDWLPQGHLALFISDIVDELYLTPIYSYYEKEERGAPPYDPRMMTKVLFLCLLHRSAIFKENRKETRGRYRLPLSYRE